LTLNNKYAIIIIEIRKGVIIMAKGMTPSKRHAMRAMYEARDKARKNERLGLRPKLSSKKGKRK
jgi:2-hydroxychromene-2-carboxylate isomerase